MILLFKLLFSFFILGFSLWGCAAISFQISGLLRAIGILGWALVSAAALYFLWSGASGWVLPYLGAVAVFITVWALIPAKLDRNWMPELAHTVTGDVQGRQVSLRNVRDFNWATGEQAWVDRDFDLDQLNGLDVFLSYWGNPKIAHVIVSFRFADTDPIAFSVEIRKEVGEVYSSLGGFFKKFELAFIAANESDIVALRTNHRDPIEDVYLYPLTTNPAEREALFLGYVERANRLAENPAWYHTLRANCTTVVFDLVRDFRQELKLDTRIILSGLLPDLFAERGVLDFEQPYGDYRTRAAITDKAQAISPHESYSTAIRK